MELLIAHVARGLQNIKYLLQIPSKGCKSPIWDKKLRGRNLANAAKLEFAAVPALPKDETQLASWGGIRLPRPCNNSAWRLPKCAGTWYLVPGVKHVTKY